MQLERALVNVLLVLYHAVKGIRAWYLFFLVSRARSTSESRKPMTTSENLVLSVVIFESVLADVMFI